MFGLKRRERVPSFRPSSLQVQCHSQGGQHQRCPHGGETPQQQENATHGEDGALHITSASSRTQELKSLHIRAQVNTGVYFALVNFTHLLTTFFVSLRLFTSIDDEYVVAMGLRETGGSGGVLSQIVSLPQGAVLKVQFATNIKSLRETKEVARLCERAVALARSQLLDRITVHDVNLAGGRGDIRYIFFTFLHIMLGFNSQNRY